MTETLNLSLSQKAIKAVCEELKEFQPSQIETVLALLEEGNTIPFIARYRKDRTNSLDEVQIKSISDRFSYLENLLKRKEEITRLIDEQGKLTDELLVDIEQANTLAALEDVYRPFKQKRRTKATIAKEAGLEPLALWILSTPQNAHVEEFALSFIQEKMNILSVEDALAGAHEIICEYLSDQANYRKWIRQWIHRYAFLESKLKNPEKDTKKVYEMYYEYSEPISKIVPHRVLALNRAEKEDVLKVTLVVNHEPIITYLKDDMIKNSQSEAGLYVERAIEDSLKRFLFPSIEREIRNELTEMAEKKAIEIFGENVKHLLLQSPMKGHVIMGLDPAYRTGCKLAIIDETGRVLDKDVIYPHKGASDYKRSQAGERFCQLIEQYKVTLVAIGNGTASRESELFVSQELKHLPRNVQYTIVSEAGASVYSASEIARLEFPDYQVEERSAVSIARRLQDPLSELVKIDPKAVGVGQYQHDVSQKELDLQLQFVVETAVNQVGVNLNTASAALLQYVAGLTKTTANNIVNYRNENGKFEYREQLKQVKRLGPKAFEQAIGFLRIVDGSNVLDNTPIHPESYDVAQYIIEKAGLTLEQIGTPEATKQLATLSIQKIEKETGIGKKTIELIIEGLSKPGLDPREEVEGPILRQDVLSMEDLEVGMKINGTVRNVVDFGAFVDIGVKQDGLIHISRISKKFVKHPSEILAVGDIVEAWIIEVDTSRNRIALSLLPFER